MTERVKILFGTGNPGKQREIRGLLEGLPVDILFLQDVGDPPEVEETGTTFEDNARLKARGYASLLPGAYVAAEDSGIVVPALGGEPGVYSARYGGTRDNDAHNALLLERLKGFEGKDRSAYYEAVVVLMDPEGRESVFRGRVDGFIAKEPHGNGGFCYDPVFFHEELGRTFGCVSQTDKDRFSHRGRAVQALRAHLEKVLDV